MYNSGSSELQLVCRGKYIHSVVARAYFSLSRSLARGHHCCCMCAVQSASVRACAHRCMHTKRCDAEKEKGRRASLESFPPPPAGEEEDGPRCPINMQICFVAPDCFPDICKSQYTCVLPRARVGGDTAEGARASEAANKAPPRATTTTL